MNVIWLLCFMIGAVFGAIGSQLGMDYAWSRDDYSPGAAKLGIYALAGYLIGMIPALVIVWLLWTLLL